MWIECKNKKVRRLYDREIMDEAVEFNDNRTAQVEKEIGEKMAARYEDIEIRNNDDEEENSEEFDGKSMEETVEEYTDKEIEEL